MKSSKFFSVLLAIVLFCFANTQSAKAQDLYFFLYNDSGYTISQVYVSPSEYRNWNNNLIPRSYVYDESQLTVYVPAHYGYSCSFDIKVITTGGTKWTFTDVDLCCLYRLTINWDDTYSTEWGGC